MCLINVVVVELYRPFDCSVYIYIYISFPQRFSIDYLEIYSLVVDAIFFKYFISLTMYENLDIHLMIMVIAYLYGSLCCEIYICRSLKDLNYRKHVRFIKENVQYRQIKSYSGCKKNLDICGTIVSRNIS